MNIDDVARRIVADNQRARERGSSAFRSLTEQLLDPNEQVNTDDILNQLSGESAPEPKPGVDEPIT